MIDRNFAEAPPVCVRQAQDFQFVGSVWAEIGAEGAKQAIALEACLRDIAGWIESEEKARGITYESD